MDPNNNPDTTNQDGPELSSSAPSVNDVNPVTTSPIDTTPEMPSPVPPAAPINSSVPFTDTNPVASVQPAAPEQPVTAPAPTPATAPIEPVAVAQPTVQIGGSSVKKGPLIALVVLAVILVGALVYWFI